MDNVKLPADAILPKSGGLGSPFSCLNNARYGISWGVMGALEDCIARAREYALERSVAFHLPPCSPFLQLRDPNDVLYLSPIN